MPEMCRTLIQEYGYSIFFLVLLAGTMGFPVPDEGILLFAGVLVARGDLLFLPALAVGTLAVLAGTLANYWIAFNFGRWKTEKWERRVNFKACRWQRIIGVLYRFGLWAVPFAFFIPGIRMSASYAAGILRLPVPGYVISSLAGVVAWVGFYLWLGTGIGQ